MPDVLKQRLQECTDTESVLACALSRTLELSGTELGNIQLMDWSTGELAIAAQHGFDDEFLNFFRRVRAEDGSACGRVLRTRRPVAIVDVLFDPEYVPCRAAALKAGFRAVRSAPLISDGGELVGVLSTHFATAHRSDSSEIELMQRVAELTANAIVYHRARVRLTDGRPMTDIEKLAEQTRKGLEAMARFDDLTGGAPRRDEP